MNEMARMRIYQALAAELVRQTRNHTDVMAAMSATLERCPTRCSRRLRRPSLHARAYS